jgi:hypothetical protein
MPKKIVPLTDIQVKTSKAASKDVKLYDGGGLILLISQIKYDASGRQLPVSKLWRLDYRFGDKRKLMALGAYPAVSLADARHKRDEARKLLASGVDPSEIRKAQKAAQGEQDSNTFEVIAATTDEEWTHPPTIN